MARFDFAKCSEVDDDIIERALAPAQSMGEEPPRARAIALLQRMARVSTPAADAPRILDVLSRVAASSWVDGLLEVRLSGFGPATTIDILVFDGVSFERLMPSLSVGAPLEEFIQDVVRRREALEPLTTLWDDPGVELILRASGTPPESSRGVTHRTEALALEKKDTLKVEHPQVPKEAFRQTRPGARPAPTVRVPAARPAPGTQSGPGDGDDGWE